MGAGTDGTDRNMDCDEMPAMLDQLWHDHAPPVEMLVDGGSAAATTTAVKLSPALRFWHHRPVIRAKRAPVDTPA